MLTLALVTPRMVKSMMSSLRSRSFFWVWVLSTTRKRGNIGRLAIRVSGSASLESVGVGVEHGVDVLLCPDMLISLVRHLPVCTSRLSIKCLWLETKFAKNAWAMTSTKGHPNAHGCPTPKGQPLPVTHSPQSHALAAYFNSPQGRISPPLLEWGCPV